MAGLGAGLGAADAGSACRAGGAAYFALAGGGKLSFCGLEVGQLRSELTSRPLADGLCCATGYESRVFNQAAADVLVQNTRN